MNKNLNRELKVQTTGVVLLRFGILFFVAGCIGISVFLVGFKYESFTQLAFGQYQQPEKLAKFRSTLLTPERFSVLRYISVTLTLLVISGTWWIWKRIPRFVLYVQEIAFSIRIAIAAVWKQTSVAEQVCLAILCLVCAFSRLYFLPKLPLHVDERFTYLYFVSKGWLVSAAYYPNPNNHILFSLLCNAANWLFSSPLRVLRVSAFVCGLAAMAGFWLTVRYYFSALFAALATAMLAFTPPVFGYGIQGRGYSLLLFWVIVSAAAIVKIVSSREIKPAVASLFGISSVLGFYTIPVFLYPFAGMMCVLVLYFRKNTWQQWRRLGILLAVIASGIGLLYMPVFLVNGPQSVSGNSWVEPLPWQVFWKGFGTNLIDTSTFFWNDSLFSPYLTLVVSILAISVAFSSKTPLVERIWLWLFVSCLWIVVPIVLLQRTVIYSRTLIFVFPFQWLAVCILIRRFWLSQRYYFSILSVITILLAGNCIQTFQQLITSKGRGIYNSLDGVTHWLWTHKATNLFVQYYEYGLCIRFQYETNQHPIELDIGADRFFPEKKYNFVVVHKSHPFPQGLPPLDYATVYQDEEATIYARKTQ